VSIFVILNETIDFNIAVVHNINLSMSSNLEC